MKKKHFSTNEAGITGCQYVVEFKQIHIYAHAHSKLKSKQINIKPATLKRKVGSNIKCMGTGDFFLKITLVAQTLRATINTWDLLKLRSFCKAKDMAVYILNHQTTSSVQCGHIVYNQKHYVLENVCLVGWFKEWQCQIQGCISVLAQPASNMRFDPPH